MLCLCHQYVIIDLPYHERKIILMNLVTLHQSTIQHVGLYDPVLVNTVSSMRVGKR